MEKLGYFSFPCQFVEFGSGRGELTSYVSRAAHPDAKFLLIDRKNYRRKVYLLSYYCNRIVANNEK